MEAGLEGVLSEGTSPVWWRVEAKMAAAASELHARICCSSDDAPENDIPMLAHHVQAIAD